MSTIVVRFTAEGWHRWPGATGKRGYLGHRHRHLFHVEVKMPVTHDDREIEFHDLLDEAKQLFGSGEFGDSSCETLAARLASTLCHRHDRWCEVQVMEDGEAGAIVKVETTSHVDHA